MSTPSVADLLAGPPDTSVDEAGVPRSNGRPMIAPVPGDEHLAFKTGVHKGLVPYMRSSYYGSEIEDTTKLVQWQKRQVARGVALLYERAKLAPGPHGGLLRNPAIEPGRGERELKAYWDGLADRAEEEVGSYRWARHGTAIHYGTELVDGGLNLSELAPEIRERAEAYARFRDDWGIRPTSIEQFGVEDTHRIAGTWDRTMWFRGKHVIGDVKTSGTMDFAGIGFAVQLAVYAHMREYDPVTRQRRDRDVPVDLDEAWIIHVGREPQEPITLHRVDIAEGWRFAGLVREVLEARKVGRAAVGGPEPDDFAGVSRCTTRAQLEAFMSTNPVSAEMTELANEMWRLLP